MSQEVIKYEAEKPVGSAKTLSNLLESPQILAKMAAVVPKWFKPERLVKTVLIAASRQPKLFQCTQESLLKSTMIGAELGLDCSGTLGRAYLVPYRNKNGNLEAQFIIGYMGLIDLVRRSGDVQSITAHVVYKQDHFRLEQGLVEILEHRPNIEVDQKDADIIGAYMIARFKDGGHHIEWMTRKQIDGIRARSRAKDSGPWVDSFSQMCRKTVLRRGVKYLPLAISTLEQLAQADEEFEQSAFTTTVPETGSLSLEDFTAKQETAEEPPEDPAQPEQANAFEDPDAAKYPENARKMFYARCTGKKFNEDQRHRACAELFEAVGIQDWPEIQDSTKYAEIVDWINRNISARK